MEALISVNWVYSSKYYNRPLGCEKDGMLMEKLLTDGGYENTVVVENAEDIRKVVKDFVSTREMPLERFHFHYSG